MIGPGAVYRTGERVVGRGAIYVYRLYDAAGDLLYVGVSQDVGFRLYMHSRTKPWYGEVASRRLVGPYLSRKAAEDEELRAIQTENPRHNIAHTERLTPLLIAAHRDRRVHVARIRAARQTA